MHSATIQRYLAELGVTAPSISISGAAPCPGHDEEDGLSSEFSASVSQDAESIQAVVGGMERQEVQQFMDILCQCRGEIFLSGIGEWGSCVGNCTANMCGRCA